MITPQVVQSSISKQPDIQLSKFSGEYEEWETFRNQFLSLINNEPTLSDTTRLQYIKTCLSGKAEQMLKNLKKLRFNLEENENPFS